MFGTNPITRQDLNAMLFRVTEIFYTIQGEGPFVGRPSVFIRMAGCNLRCHFCDTDFAVEKSDAMTGDQILETVVKLWQENIESDSHSCQPLAVITGGEPMLQPIAKFIEPLIKQCGFQCQIETAGTVWVPFDKELLANKSLTLVCSPKTPSINAEVEKWCRDFKYIVRTGEWHNGRPHGQTQAGRKDTWKPLFWPHPGATVYVQPCEEYDKQLPLGRSAKERSGDNLREAIRLALSYGYVLSPQMHKIVGLP